MCPRQDGAVHIRRVTIQRYRGAKELTLHPGPITVLLGANNTGKTTILEALDLLLHHGVGRARPNPTELDYFGRDTAPGFEIEAVLANLPLDVHADVVDHLEGWHSGSREILSCPDGDGVEPVVRVKVVGSSDFDLTHGFAKPESDGVRFSPRLRRRLGWFFDGRHRDPTRELSFYQGSVLDRLFHGLDLDEPVQALRTALSEGAGHVNDHDVVRPVLDELGIELHQLGLGQAEEHPAFEVGGVTSRELLQALRLAMPGPNGVMIPLAYQGRGAQRLLLVSVLLRLAERGATGQGPIVALDEPEQALEPLRQAQLAGMLRGIAAKGGQLFLSTHSTDLTRGFTIDDLVLIPDDHGPAKALSTLSSQAKQGYERRLDGPVVRALFAPLPLLVEGPGDRPVLQTFWTALADAGSVVPMEHLGADVINCEGANLQPQAARMLHEAGKTVIAWAEQDRPDVLDLLRTGQHCAALLVHDPDPRRQALEGSLAYGAPVPTLGMALQKLAEVRDYEWDAQLECLKAGLSGTEVTPETRATAAATTSTPEFLATLDDADARALVARLLAPTGKNKVTPFEMKGAWQARIVAEVIVEDSGVPAPYVSAITGLAEWIRGGCQPRGHEIILTSPDQS